MYSFMESARPSVYVGSSDEGVERVKKSEGLYAYLMESTGIEYVLERNCELTQIGGLLDHKSYGIALQPGEPRWNKLKLFFELNSNSNRKNCLNFNRTVAYLPLVFTHRIT